MSDVLVRIPALSVVVPAHELTISGCDAGKVGSCRCGGWSFTGPVSSDDLSRLFLVHLADERAVHLTSCDVCLAGVATVRDGCVERCSVCAFDDLRAVASMDLAASA